MSDEFDIGGEATASPDTLKHLHTALEEAISLQELADKMSDDLKTINKTIQSLRTNRIPDLMATLQMEKLTFGGWDVKVDDFISGSLPKEPQKREQAIQWLVDHGGEDIIKTALSADFGRQEYQKALTVASMIKDKTGCDAVVEEGVHPQTLAKFARERIECGEEIDTEVLGLYTGRVAKFKKLKK